MTTPFKYIYIYIYAFLEHCQTPMSMQPKFIQSQCNIATLKLVNTHFRVGLVLLAVIVLTSLLPLQYGFMAESGQDIARG